MTARTRKQRARSTRTMEEKGKYHKHDHDVLRKDHASGVFGAELWVLFEPKRFIEGLCRLEGRDGQVDEDFRGE